MYDVAINVWNAGFKGDYSDRDQLLICGRVENYSTSVYVLSDGNQF